MRTIGIAAATALLFSCIAYPQQSVNQADGPPSGPGVQTVFLYSGSSVSAICWAQSSAKDSNSNRHTTKVAVSAVSKANPAVVTSAGHGFTLLTLPQITVSGATGTGWTAINTTFTATVIDANTFSIPIDSSGFGTLAGTVVFSTTAPRQTVAEWAVQMFGYGGPSGAVSFKGWLQGSTSMTAKCSDATVSGKGVQ